MRIIFYIQFKFFMLGALFCALCPPAFATSIPFNTSTNMNIGIGTSTPQAAFVVANGNVGIGTWTAAQIVDVIGTAKMTGFQLSTNPSSGYVLMSNTVGVGSWVPASAVGGGGSVSGLTTGYLPKAASSSSLSDSAIFQSGSNIGIGTASANAVLEVNGALQLDGPGDSYVSSGNFGIGTAVPGSALQVSNTMSFTTEYDNGNSGAGLTVNWNNGNKQKITLTAGTVTLAYTAPTTGVANLLLKVVQDGSGSRGTTFNWPAGTKWPGGAAPTLSTAAASIDIVSCYYDRSSYNCVASLNFQ